jgi:hypothetical protein
MSFAIYQVCLIAESARDTLYRARDLAVMKGDSSQLAYLFSTVLSPL